MASTDVVGYYQSEAKACFAVLHYVNGNLLDKDYEILPVSDSAEEAVSTLVKQYYLARNAAPKEILLPVEIEDAALFEQLLLQNLQKRVHIRVPQRGDGVRLMKRTEDAIAQSLSEIRESRTKFRALVNPQAAKPSPIIEDI